MDARVLDLWPSHAPLPHSGANSRASAPDGNATPAPREAEPPTSAAREQNLIRCLPMLRAYVRRLVGDQDMASDIVQNISLTILTSTARPTDVAGFAAWCRGVARNVAAYELRSRRRLQLILPVGDDLANAPDPLADPEDDTASRTALERLASHLEPPALELLFRRYVLGESAKELALELSQSPAALRMRLMRLKSHLRASARRTPAGDDESFDAEAPRSAVPEPLE